MARNEAAPDFVAYRKRHRPDKGHGGAWKVAYADFVTAMMALFIVLWVLNQDKSIIQAVGGYFKNPDIKFESSGSANPSGLSGPSGPSVSVDPRKLDDSQWKEAQKERLKATAQSIVSELQKSPEFSGLTDQIKIEIVSDGLRIEVVESSKDVFFEIGTAELKPSTIRLMEKIGTQLKQLPNKVVVEGHTDSRPYAGVGPLSNFELSADRANAARRALTSGGLSEKQIEEIRGCADSHLRDAADPFNVVNRRISILVRYGNSG
jgi:chemotaxis protein MotB